MKAFLSKWISPNVLAWLRRPVRAQAGGHPMPTAPAIPAVNAAERVSTHWANMAVLRQQTSMMGWLDSPIIQQLCVEPEVIRGSNQGSWLTNIHSQFPITRNGRWLSLGCGAANEEIYAAEKGIFSSLDAYDISEGALQVARKNALAKGLKNIRFLAKDINDSTFPPACYDVATMSMALHHVAKLDRLLEQVLSTLKPEGWFLVNEYVGPSQFQFGDKEMGLVEDLLALLPNDLRYDYVRKEVKKRYLVQPREFWDQADPSESVCSDQIPAALRRHFEVVRQIDYGGALLNPLLEHIIANFHADNPYDVALLQMLVFMEKTLMREGIIPSHFSIFVMRKPGGG